MKIVKSPKTEPQAPVFKESWLALGLLIVLPLWFYRDYLFCQSFIWEDALYLAYPYTHHALKSLLAGHIPLWLPNLCNGVPNFVAINIICYLPHWLLLPFMSGGQLSVAAFQAFLVLHVIAGGLFMYWFLRDCHYSPLPSAAGGVVLQFSAFMTLNIIHVTFIEAYIWLPLQLLLVRRVLATRQVWHYIALIAVICVSLNAGHPQITLYTSYLVVAYWLFHFWMSHCTASTKLGKLRAVASELLRITGVYATVLALCMVSILPSLELMRNSPRGAWGLKEMADQSMPFYYLLQFFIPNFFGSVTGTPVAAAVPYWGFNQSSADVQKIGWGIWHYWEFGAYGGQLAVVAVIVLLFNLRHLTSRREICFFLVAAGIAILFMLGKYAGLFNLLFYVLPGVGLFRLPARMGCVLDFALAALVTALIDASIKDVKLKLRKPLLVIGVVYMIVFLCAGSLIAAIAPARIPISRALANTQGQIMIAAVVFGVVATIVWALGATGWASRRKPLITALVILAAIDTYCVFGEFHKGSADPTDYYADHAGLTTQLPKLNEKNFLFRIQQTRDGVPVREMIYPQAFPLFHEEFAFTDGYLTLYPHDFSEFQGLTNSAVKFDIENVQLLLNYDSQKRQLGLRENATVLPRVAFYSQAKIYPSTVELLADLEGGKCSYHSCVAVLSKDVKDMAPVLHAQGNSLSANQVTIVQHSPARYLIQYKTDRPGIVFVSETAYPGWKVQDHRFRVITVFGSFIGVVIPFAGEGEIDLQFSSTAVRRGVFISSAGVLAVLLFAFAARLRRPQSLTVKTELVGQTHNSHL